MGLDMYLSAKKYVSGWNFDGSRDTSEYDTLREMYGMKKCEGSPSAEVSFNVGYWRKANAIHGWFVRECGGGVDECQVMYVDREKLLALKNHCLAALAKKPASFPQPVASTGTPINSFTDIGTAIAQEWAIQTHEAEFNDPDETDPLRPTAGFFFGNTEKNEWYYEDLEQTVEILDSALSLGDEWSYTYQASW
jgi:hypothetical protein